MPVENKQRLVGIIVLVVFVALLIPFLLVGGSSQKKPGDTADNVAPATIDQAPAVVAATPGGKPDQDASKNMVAQNSITSVQPELPPSMQAQGLPAAPQNAQTPMKVTEGLPEGQNAVSIPAKIESKARPPQLYSPIAPGNQLLPPKPPTPVMPAPNSQMQPSLPPQMTSPIVPPTAQPVNPQPAASQPMSQEMPQPVIKTPAAVAQQTNPISIQTQKISPAVIAAPQAMTIREPVVTPVAIKRMVATKSVSNKTITKSSSGEYWAVQLGSFAEPKHVQKLVQKLRAEGFHGATQKVQTSHGMLIRIVVGHEHSREQADLLAKKLQKAVQINGKVTRIRT